MIKVCEVYDRTVNVRNVAKYGHILALTETPTTKRQLPSAYNGPKTTVLTDLVVAIWLYGVANHDSGVLHKSR